MLHETLPVAECPFEWSPLSRTGRRATEHELGIPPIDRLVMCHGDPCSPNTLIGADGIEPDARRIAYYRFLWDNEDKIGVAPEAASELRACYR